MEALRKAYRSQKVSNIGNITSRDNFADGLKKLKPFNDVEDFLRTAMLDLEMFQWATRHHPELRTPTRPQEQPVTSLSLSTKRDPDYTTPYEKEEQIYPNIDSNYESHPIEFSFTQSELTTDFLDFQIPENDQEELFEHKFDVLEEFETVNMERSLAELQDFCGDP